VSLCLRVAVLMAPGALVLAHSLRDAGTKKKLVVFVAKEIVSGEAIIELLVRGKISLFGSSSDQT
jgi:hypothetical protein